MKFDSKHIGTVIVAIPVFHLLSASLYLWSYCTGFGGKLGGFTTSADLFTTSITNMVIVYASALLVPFFFNVHKYFPGYQAPTLPSTIGGREVNFRKVTNYVFIGLGLMFVIEELFIVFWLGREVRYFLFLMAANLLLAPMLFRLAELLNLSRLGGDVIYFLPMLFLSAFFLGLDAGSIDRQRGYAESRFEYGRCGKALVIRQIADNYLVIRPSGRKALVDKDCKIRIKFPLVSKAITN